MNRSVEESLALEDTTETEHTERFRSHDLGASFLFFQGHRQQHLSRVALAAALWVSGADGEEIESFVLTERCRAENVGAVGDEVFRLPSYSWFAVANRDEVVTVGRHSFGPLHVDRSRTLFNASVRIDLRTARARALSTFEEIVSAAADGQRLSARTEITVGALRVTIEYPIKTININSLGSSFQVDTGPVIVAFPARSGVRHALAHVAYRNFEVVHLLVEDPNWLELLSSRRRRVPNGRDRPTTSVTIHQARLASRSGLGRDGQVFRPPIRFRKVVTLAARNTIFALDAAR